MSIEQEQLNRAIALAKICGATRLILFGSAAINPEEARDLDLACDGVEGWEFYELLSLQGDVADREPTVREKTAAAAFLVRSFGFNG